LTAPATSAQSVFSALRGFGRNRAVEERCELCSLPIAKEHPHLLRRSKRQILCACDPCGILFTHRDDAADLIRIPRDARRLDGFEIGDQQWSALRLPIDLAFFLQRSETSRVAAYYPSPAGPTESLLPLDAWRDIADGASALDTMQTDVEALLVNRTHGNRLYFIAPLDQCYRLTGIIRMEWRGFSGGDTVWKAIDAFFASLRESARA
jgi:hypothetical protein